MRIGSAAAGSSTARYHPDAETSRRNDRPDNGGFPKAPEITYLVHGEPPTMVALKAKIEQRLHWRVYTPEYLEEVQV